jgi:hypothetical protein
MELATFNADAKLEEETNAETAVAMLIFKGAEVDGKRRVLASSVLYNAIARSPGWTLYARYSPAQVPTDSHSHHQLPSLSQSFPPHHDRRRHRHSRRVVLG